MIARLRHDRRARALARSVPGLSPSYHGVRKALQRARRTARLDYRPTRVVVRTSSREIVEMRLQPVDKEPWTVEWLERELRAGDVLYDIGANIGVYSLIAAKIARDATIVAFEPAYATFAELCENLILNDAMSSVVPLPVVLGDDTRVGRLAYRDTTAGAADHALDEESGTYVQQVLVHALDDLVARFGLDPPTLVKLDVDGAEAEVLRGARAVLRSPQLRSLVVEVENANTEDVQRELADAGFRLERRVDDRYGKPLPGIWYGVFAR